MRKKTTKLKLRMAIRMQMNRKITNSSVLLDLYFEIKKQQEDEDTDMLIRLIKIRQTSLDIKKIFTITHKG